MALRQEGDEQGLEKAEGRGEGKEWRMERAEGTVP